MIIKASAKYKTEIYRIWKNVFAHDDHGSIDFFFAHYYDECQTYIIKNEREIISGVCVFTVPIHLFSKVIYVSYLVGIFTKEDYQRKGYMKTLLHEVLDICSNNTLISVLMAYNPIVYEPLGFVPFINHQIVQLSSSMITPVSTMNVTYQVESEQLLKAYNKFMNYFDGYKSRNSQDFDVLKEDLQSQHGKLVGYIENQEVLGYMMYVVHDQQIEIIEIVYFTVDTLMRLLYFASNINSNIKVHISTKENWKGIFPKATVENQEFLYGRINDVALFNDLFNTSIQSLSEIDQLVNKPLFFNEYQ